MDIMTGNFNIRRKVKLYAKLSINIIIVVSVSELSFSIKPQSELVCFTSKWFIEGHALKKFLFFVL